MKDNCMFKMLQNHCETCQINMKHYTIGFYFKFYVENQKINTALVGPVVFSKT